MPVGVNSPFNWDQKPHLDLKCIIERGMEALSLDRADALSIDHAANIIFAFDCASHQRAWRMRTLNPLD